MGVSLWGGIFAFLHMKKVRRECCEVFDKVFMLFSGYGHFFVVSYIEIREKGVSVFMGYYYGFDWTYGLVLLAMAISLIVQFGMKNTFSTYSRIPSQRGLRGWEAARMILDGEGLYQVQVQHVAGSLTDHYDPRTKTVNLSDASYNSTSLAALGVAAHECGHALQDARGYAPLQIRSALVPVANFGSSLSWPLFLAGLFFSIRPLLTAGIVLFCGALLFQIVTLPVEFNASRRALQQLSDNRMLYEDEVRGSKKVLRAAAMTYVAAVISSLLQLLRLLLLSQNRRRD